MLVPLKIKVEDEGCLGCLGSAGHLGWGSLARGPMARWILAGRVKRNSDPPPQGIFFTLYPIRILTTRLLISSVCILTPSLLCADCRRFLTKDLFAHSPGILLIPPPL